MWSAFVGMENLFNSEFGEPCVYTPLGGSPTNILADYRSEGLIAGLSGEDRVEIITHVALVRNADVPNPQHGDTMQFTLRGLTLAVRGIFDADLNMTKLVLE